MGPGHQDHGRGCGEGRKYIIRPICASVQGCGLCGRMWADPITEATSCSRSPSTPSPGKPGHQKIILYTISWEGMVPEDHPPHHMMGRHGTRRSFSTPYDGKAWYHYILLHIISWQGLIPVDHPPHNIMGRYVTSRLSSPPYHGKLKQP